MKIEQENISADEIARMLLQRKTVPRHSTSIPEKITFAASLLAFVLALSSC